MAMGLVRHTTHRSNARAGCAEAVTMFATRVYFSLSEITDPRKHRDHNEWHQLDHQPENLLLPGVALGGRWVRSPDCAAVSTGAVDDYTKSHYGIMYWFREPMTEPLDDFFALSE